MQISLPSWTTNEPFKNLYSKTFGWFVVLDEFRIKKFEYINGYTSSLVIFAKFLIERNIALKDICPSIKVVFPTSEVVDDIDRKTMERGFGVNVRNEYGAAELDILAFEDEDGDFVLN